MHICAVILSVDLESMVVLIGTTIFVQEEILEADQPKLCLSQECHHKNAIRNSFAVNTCQHYDVAMSYSDFCSN